MRAVLTATSLAALIAASSALAQSEYPAAQDPTLADPPAAMEPAAPMPDAGASDPAESPSMTETDPATSPATPDTPAQAAAPQDKFIPQQDQDDLLASSLIGSAVQNSAGEELGSINDVAMSEEGTVDAILIGVGGFLGIGEKNVGVTFDAIDVSADENGSVILVLDTTAEELEAAPQYVTVEAANQQQAETQATPAPASPAPAYPAPAQ